MSSARWVRRAAFAGAAGCVVVAFLPAAPAGAQSGPPGIFSGHAEAAGFEFTLDTIPAQSINDPVDVRIPAGIAELNSSGNSTASAGLVYPGGGGQIPGALCLLLPAIGSAFPPQFPQIPGCDQISKATGQPFPPPYPLAVTVPTSDGKTSASETIHGQQLGSPSSIGADPLDASATADNNVAKSTAVDNSLSALAGTPLAVTAESSKATTNDSTVGNDFVTKAETILKNVEIGGVVHIGSIDAIATVTNDGNGHVTKSGHVTIGDVTAMGHGAVIDNHGISILGQGDGGAVNKQLNQLLQKALQNDGIQSVHTIGTTVTNLSDGAAVQAGGVVVTYKEHVNKPNGVPTPAQLLTQTLCKIISQACIAPPDPFSVFVGTFTLGNAAVVDEAAPMPTFPNAPLPALGTSVLGSTGGKFTPGSPGSPGTPGSPGLPGGATSTPSGGQSPAIAPAPRAATGSDGFGNLAHKLTLLFPAFLLAAVGVLAGRFRRLPARLPRVV